MHNMHGNGHNVYCMVTRGVRAGWYTELDTVGPHLSGLGNYCSIRVFIESVRFIRVFEHVTVWASTIQCWK